MIFGDDHVQVVENIKQAAQDRDFYRKVEVNDPNLTQKERTAILSNYLRRKTTLGYWACNLSARVIAWIWTKGINRHTKIEGLKYLSGIKGGAVVTSNHFSPIDNTVVRQTIQRAFHQRLYIVSQDTNLAMKGFFGFLMNYSDIIPICGSHKYMSDYFGPTIQDLLDAGEKVLIYPEQEMWLNYRKPRPPKRGAYYYASIHSVPVLSFFVEIKTLQQKETDEFYRTKFVMHVLPPIYPDPNKTVRENSRQMMEIDYRQKKEAYEKAYGKPLTYDYEPGDVAGWALDEEELMKEKSGQ